MIDRCVTCGQRMRKGYDAHKCNTQRKAKRELGAKIVSFSAEPSQRKNRKPVAKTSVYALDTSRERGERSENGYRVA